MENKNIDQVVQSLDGDKKINPLEKKDYVMEYFVKDENVIKEYKQLMRPIRDRALYTIYFDTFMCFLIYQYAKRVNYYAERFYPNRRKGVGNLIVISTVHAIGVSALFLVGNFAILGINPFRFYKKYKEIDEKIMQEDSSMNATAEEIFSLIQDKFGNKWKLK